MLSICSWGPIPELPSLTKVLFFCGSFQVGSQNSTFMENSRYSWQIVTGKLDEVTAVWTSQYQVIQECQWQENKAVSGRVMGWQNTGNYREKLSVVSFHWTVLLCSTGFHSTAERINVRSSTQAAGWKLGGKASPTPGLMSPNSAVTELRRAAERDASLLRRPRDTEQRSDRRLCLMRPFKSHHSLVTSILMDAIHSWSKRLQCYDGCLKYEI